MQKSSLILIKIFLSIIIIVELTFVYELTVLTITTCKPENPKEIFVTSIIAGGTSLLCFFAMWLPHTLKTVCSILRVFLPWRYKKNRRRRCIIKRRKKLP